MANQLIHRGPDDSGVWVDCNAGIALGHRRLSVIDLSPHGHQPMHSVCRRYSLVFNGEIYNFLQLRHELQDLGHVFKGHSDTEVLLAAVVQWGVMSALHRFNGMFAFALWDADQRCLHLARDRAGEKPLYYQWTGHSWIFGSELKALFAHPDFRGTIDYEAIWTYFRYGYIPAPSTPFKKTYKLIPGTMLTISADRISDDLEPVPYWSARHTVKEALAKPWTGSFQSAEDELHSLLLDAIRLRMVADVPLGAFLSGGIDSSLVVALMQAQSPQPIRTFTVGFDDDRYDESRYARAVAHHLGTDHTELRVSSKEALAVVPSLANLFDEPMSDSSQIPTYLIAALTRRHVTVSLSGDAGDELFGGYGRYIRSERIRGSLALWPKPLRLLASSILHLAQAAEPLMKGRLQPMSGWIHKLHAAITAKNDDELYDVLLSRWQVSSGIVKGAGGVCQQPGIVNRELLLSSFQERMMFIDLMTYLPDDILVKVDRASMGVSLETRIPLLDHRVIEYAWRLPLEYKIKEDKGKWLLRQVLYRYVPSELVERPKMGFGVPLGEWLRGSLREWAEELLDEHSIRKGGILSYSPIQDTWKCHLDGRWDRSAHLWDVLIFQSWIKEYSHVIST